MYVIRDIFQLKFGLFKEAKQVLKIGFENGLFAKRDIRILSDFTGQAYRLILEMEFNSLADYENELQTHMTTASWQAWYAQFKQNIEGSHREILKSHALT